jgi:hypothetical protein
MMISRGAHGVCCLARSGCAFVCGARPPCSGWSAAEPRPSGAEEKFVHQCPPPPSGSPPPPRHTAGALQASLATTAPHHPPLWPGPPLPIADVVAVNVKQVALLGIDGIVCIRPLWPISMATSRAAAPAPAPANAIGNTPGLCSKPSLRPTLSPGYVSLTTRYSMHAVYSTRWPSTRQGYTRGRGRRGLIRGRVRCGSVGRGRRNDSCERLVDTDRVPHRRLPLRLGPRLHITQ